MYFHLNILNYLCKNLKDKECFMFYYHIEVKTGLLQALECGSARRVCKCAVFAVGEILTRPTEKNNSIQ